MNKKRPLKVYDLKPGHIYFLIVDPSQVNHDSLRASYKELKARGITLVVSFVQDIDRAVKFVPNPGEETVATDSK